MMLPDFAQAPIQTFQQQKAKLVAHYERTQQPLVFLQAHTKSLEQLLWGLWQPLFKYTPLALLAIGGFGRAETYPHSDLDLAIVGSAPLNETEQALVSQFVQLLWDIGLMPAIKVGSIEQLAQSAEEDLTSDTAFLEGRFLCGQKPIAEALLTLITHQRDVVNFIESKLLEQEQRHLSAQASGSLLEPNIKTAPGGLRDLHVILWLAKAQGLKPHFSSLVHSKLLSWTEARLLTFAHKQLAKIRIQLHLSAGRPEERIIFDLQTKIAEAMGYKDDEQQIKSEKLMKQFFRATKVVKQLNGILKPTLVSRVYQPWPRITKDLSEHFYQVGTLVGAKDLTIFKTQPETIFALFNLVQTNPELTGIAPRALRAVWLASLNIDQAFYDNPTNRQQFVQFFKNGRGLTHLLRALNLYGLLGRYLPAFGKIVGHMQHDLFHVYPVDEHILMVVRNMRRLAIEAHSHELPFASDLMQHFEKKHILYLAAFFHDIAKGRGGDHAQLGIQDAQTFAEDHFLNQEETDLLTWLVADHLVMSITAQKEDIQNPEVIQRFCERVQTKERLVALYLLTVADIRGTNPKIWNNWKASLLQGLFHAAMKHFNGDQQTEQDLNHSRQQKALFNLMQQDVSLKQQRALWQALGEAYFARHRSKEIEWHTSLLAGKLTQSQVAIRRLSEQDALQVMVYMPTQPKLFSQLCLIFTQQQLPILAAKVFTTANHYALDSFILHTPYENEAETMAYIEATLIEALQAFIRGELCPIYNMTLKSPSRRAKHFPIAPRITFTPEDTPNVYTLDVITGDKIGLLAGIAHVLSQFNVSIWHAKISTLDARAEDSFLIKGEDLDDAKKRLALKQALLNVIEH